MADKMNYVTSGAKLGFKTGTQAKINEMILNQNLVTPDSSKLATNGTFYLTQDTHRLYVGNEDGSISSVNEGIVIVNQVSDYVDGLADGDGTSEPLTIGIIFLVLVPFSSLCKKYFIYY